MFRDEIQLGIGIHPLLENVFDSVGQPAALTDFARLHPRGVDLVQKAEAPGQVNPAFELLLWRNDGQHRPQQRNQNHQPHQHSILFLHVQILRSGPAGPYVFLPIRPDKPCSTFNTSASSRARLGRSGRWGVGGETAQQAADGQDRLSRGGLAGNLAARGMVRD